MKKVYTLLLLVLASMISWGQQGPTLPAFSTPEGESWYYLQFVSGAGVITDMGDGAPVQTAYPTGEETQLWKLVGDQNSFELINKAGRKIIFKDEFFAASSEAGVPLKLTQTTIPKGNVFAHVPSWGVATSEQTAAGVAMNQFQGAGIDKKIGTWNRNDNGSRLVFVAERAMAKMPKFSAEGQEPTWYTLQFRYGGGILGAVADGKELATQGFTEDHNQKWKFVGGVDGCQIISQSGLRIKLDGRRFKAIKEGEATQLKLSMAFTHVPRGVSFSEPAASWIITLPSDLSKGMNQAGGIGVGRPIGMWNYLDGGNGLVFLDADMLATTPDYTEEDAYDNWYRIRFKKGGHVIAEQGDGQPLKTEVAAPKSSQLWKVVPVSAGDGFRLVSRSGLTIYFEGNNYKAATEPETPLTLSMQLSPNLDFGSAWELSTDELLKKKPALAMNQNGGADAGVTLGNWYLGDVNNPLVFESVELIDVEIEEPTNGRVSFVGHEDEPIISVFPGETLKLEATPDPGYKLESLLANGQDISSTMSLTVNEPTAIIATFARITHRVTLAKTEHGTITIPGYTELEAIPQGTTLTVEATPEEGYRLATLTANDQTILGTNKFVVDRDVEIKATFAIKTFSVTVSPSEHGSIKIEGIDNLESVPYGTKLSVVATPEAWYELATLTANGQDIMGNKQFVVKSGVEVKATFRQKVGVEQIEADGLRIFPSPATTHIQIDGVAAGTSIRLISLTGKVVLSTQIGERGRLDVSSYDRGVYILQVGRTTRRVILR